MKNTVVTKEDLLGRPRLWPSFAGVGGITVGLVILGHIWSAVQGSWMGSNGTIAVAGAAAAAVAWNFRKPVFQWLVSLQFSIALLSAVLLATAIGTVVLQGQAPEEFTAKYGDGLGGFLRLFGFDDIFHSFPFRSLMALLAASLGCVVIDKRAWRPSEWFFLFNHGGIIVVLVGGLVGVLGGMKGFIDIHQGEIANSFIRHDRFGNRTMQIVPLDFGLKLVKFEVEKLEPEWKIYVYEGHLQGGMPKVSRGLKDAAAWTKAGDSGASFRMVAVYPDFELKTGLREIPDSGGKPAALVRVFDKAGKMDDLVLVPGDDGRSGVLFPETRTLVRFYWNESDVNVKTAPTPEKHVVTWKLEASNGEGEAVVVKVGEERELAGGIRLTATAWYPDFGYDGKKKQAYSRSAEAKNPAIELNVTYPSGKSERRFVFAKHEHFDTSSGMDGAALVFAYQYVPAEQPAEREVALIGSAREVLDFRGGKLHSRQPFPAKSSEPVTKGVMAMLLQMSASAEAERTPVSRSDKWRRPVAEVEVKAAGETKKMYLKAGMPMAIGAGDAHLVFQSKPDDIKAFRSQVSVLEGGVTVRQDTIAVNHPLSYGGYRFYQSNYRREDPTYSGILVVKDPGLWVAYLGFAMMCLGVACRFYVTPWLARRRKKVGTPAI